MYGKFILPLDFSHLDHNSKQIIAGKEFWIHDVEGKKLLTQISL